MTHDFRPLRGLPALAGVLLMATTSSAGTYHYITVPLPPGMQGVALGINGANQVVGQFGDTSTTHGFVWQNGKFTQIDAPGGTGTTLHDINIHGVALGSTYTAGANIAFTYDIVTGIQTTVPIGTSNVVLPQAINRGGKVLTIVSPRNNGLLAGGLAVGGIAHILHVPGSLDTFAFALNDWTAVVGNANGGAFGDHGFKFYRGTITLIDPPGSVHTVPLFVTNSNDVGGIYWNSASKGQGFVLRGGAYTTYNYPGADETRLIGEADNGDAFGLWVAGGVQGSFMTRGGVSYNVQAKANTPTTATSIAAVNAKGNFAGSYQTGTGAGVQSHPVIGICPPAEIPCTP